MTHTPPSFQNKGRVVQFYAILSLLFIGVFAYTISSGGFDNAINKIRHIASASAIESSVFLLNGASSASPSGDASYSTLGNPPLSQTQASPSPSAASGIISNSIGGINSDMATSGSVVLSGDQNTDPNLDINHSATTSSLTLATTPDNVIQSPIVKSPIVEIKNEVEIPSPVVRDANQYLPFSFDRSYPSDLNIFPSIFKDNVRIYDNLSGVVSIKVEAPSDNVVILIGTSFDWMKDGLINDQNGLKRVDGTTRYVYDLDTRKYSNGRYKIGAAYYNNSTWLNTASVDFQISNNAEIIKTPLGVTPTADIPKPAPAPVVKDIQIIKPALRLVVNDRHITDLKPTFDSEELELRVTAAPASAVQFFAYAVDGAFKPVLKELGYGGKDELLSRDGKEVWTYTTDMNDYPTGNFRLFARVRGIDGLLRESQPISVVVQHLSKVEAKKTVASNTAPTISKETRENILQRVRDPSTCQNRQECEVFCNNSNSAQAKCIDFVRVSEKQDDTEFSEVVKKNQEQTEISFSHLANEFIKRVDDINKVETVSSSSDWVSPEYSGRPSVMDIMPTSAILHIINSKEKITTEFPEAIKTVNDIQQYCGVIENEEHCVKTILRIAPELKDDVSKQVEVVHASEEKTTQLLEQRSGARSFIDSDNDGVSDFDEINLFNTDPAKRDTDGDGYSDGASILGQMSPVGKTAQSSSTINNIVLGQGVSVENPKITGKTQSKQFAVTSIDPLDTKDTDNKISKVLLKGIALPNSFVKVFLFSEPIVVTVKADDNGNWSYILDKTLPDGAHTAYVAMADGGGRILAKSAPLPFIKEASAITINPTNSVGGTIKPSTFMGLSPITLIALIVGLLGLSLSVVGVVIGFKTKSEA